MALHSQAPTRISFAGGGTDLPEIASQIGGCVTSVAINRYVKVTLSERDDDRIGIESEIKGKPCANIIIDKIVYNGEMDLAKSVLEEFDMNGVNVTISSSVPEHSGLGSSAAAYAALISLLAEFRGVKLSKKEIAELSFRLEREKLKNRVGKQDQYAASYGGVNYMEFSRDMQVDIRPVKMDKSTLEELEDGIALFYVAERAKSAGDVIRSQAKSAISGFEKTKELGLAARRALENNDLEEFGKVMSLVWEYKRRFSAETTTTFIEKVHSTAIENGAYGGKISGAGSGGCGFWFCRHGTKENVVSALERLGAKRLDFKFDFEGVKTWRI